MAKKILIVDDNTHIRMALCELFKRESDFEVCGEAENGKEAIEKALTLHPDLVVLDLSMSVMNGLDAARVFKDKMPSVPIILFTFYADFIKAEALPDGVTDVVSKSEHISALLMKARGLLYRDAA
jgi:two-component system, chemotaxis family, protein-glutamate methylesterase/glutaminase